MLSLGARREASAKAYRSAYPLGRLLVSIPKPVRCGGSPRCRNWRLRLTPTRGLTASLGETLRVELPLRVEQTLRVELRKRKRK